MKSGNQVQVIAEEVVNRINKNMATGFGAAYYNENFGKPKVTVGPSVIIVNIPLHKDLHKRIIDKANQIATKAITQHYKSYKYTINISKQVISIKDRLSDQSLNQCIQNIDKLENGFVAKCAAFNYEQKIELIINMIREKLLTNHINKIINDDEKITLAERLSCVYCSRTLEITAAGRNYETFYDKNTVKLNKSLNRLIPATIENGEVSVVFEYINDPNVEVALERIAKVKAIYNNFLETNRQLIDDGIEIHAQLKALLIFRMNYTIIFEKLSPEDIFTLTGMGTDNKNEMNTLCVLTLVSGSIVQLLEDAKKACKRVESEVLQVLNGREKDKQYKLEFQLEQPSKLLKKQAAEPKLVVPQLQQPQKVVIHAMDESVSSESIYPSIPTTETAAIKRAAEEKIKREEERARKYGATSSIQSPLLFKAEQEAVTCIHIFKDEKTYANKIMPVFNTDNLYFCKVNPNDIDKDQFKTFVDVAKDKVSTKILTRGGKGDNGIKIYEDMLVVKVNAKHDLCGLRLICFLHEIQNGNGQDKVFIPDRIVTHHEYENLIKQKNKRAGLITASREKLTISYSEPKNHNNKGPKCS